MSMAGNNLNPGPFVKSYFANSVNEAMQRAREQLGADAVVLNVREVSPEAIQLGTWEVVLGLRPLQAQAVPPSLKAAHETLRVDGSAWWSDLSHRIRKAAKEIRWS